MHDPTRHDREPNGWGEAFARLPAEHPPEAAWQRVAASLAGARRMSRPPARRRLAGGLALAASLVLAVALPWRQAGMPVDDTTAPPPASAAERVSAGTLPAPAGAALREESARLETLLAHARDGRVASGSAAAIAADLEARLAAIDAALADPALAPAREHALWQERVRALRTLAGFEGTRRWLAANGEHYDAALVQVN